MLDTQVSVNSRVLRDYFMYAAIDGLINLKWSRPILDEIARNQVSASTRPTKPGRPRPLRNERFASNGSTASKTTGAMRCAGHRKARAACRHGPGHPVRRSALP